MASRAPTRVEKRRGPGREIAIALGVKLLALFALWYFFFSPPHRVAVDGNAVERHLLAPPGGSSGQAPR